MPKGNRAKTKLARNEIVIASLLLLLSALGLVYASRDITQSLQVADNTFSIEVADNLAERKQGLSGRDALANDQGMLFIFDEVGMHGIWMKDMKFSIDILWIDENQTVVHIEERVSPDTYPQSFIPSVDAKYVLEIYTGQVEAQGIQIGDRVELAL